MIIMCECLPIWGVAIVLYHVHKVEGRLLFLHIPLNIGAVWHTIAFKVQHFIIFGQKITVVPICSTVLSSNLITTIVAERWFLQHVRVCYNCCCSVCVHSTTEVKGL